MAAMVLAAQRAPLQRARLAVPEPGPGQVRLRVRACGVCRTDLHVVDGELPIRSCRSCPDTRSSAGRRGRRGVSGGSASASASPGWPGLRQLRLLPRRPGKPLRPARVSPATARRRLCRARGRRRALLLADPRRISRRRGGAAALRRADRLSLAAHGRRARRIGLYGFGAAAHIVAQVRATQGRRGLRLHPAGRHRRAGFRASHRRRLGRRLR